MSGILVIVKQTIRLLLRNKGFLCSLFLVPILSVLLLNIKDYSDQEVVADQYQVYDIKDMKERICYVATNTKLPVKIYDSTEDGMGMELSKELAKAGIFQVFHCDTSTQTKEAIKQDVNRSSQNDKLGGILVIGSNFSEELRTGNLSNGIVFYNSKMDERTDLLETSISQILGSYAQIAAGLDSSDDLVAKIQENMEAIPSATEVSVTIQTEDNLSYHQMNQLSRIGYLIAILTISFLFCGVMISDTVIKERQYKVFSRILLADLSSVQYIVAKYIVSVITVLIQTGVIAIALKLILNQEYAITNLQLVITLLALGLIFNTLSLCIGILCNNVMNTNYIAFVIWSISCLLSGCYFDLSSAGTTFNNIAKLMPEKWALVAIKRMMLGQSGAYSVLLIATLAFLVIIGSFSVVGTMRSMQD